MSDNRKDLPAVTDQRFLERIREAVQTLLGFRGDELDAAITGRLALDARFRDVYNLGGGGGGGTTVVPGPAPAPAPGTEPDPTPPPTPTGLIVTPTFSNLIIEWDAASVTYSQGHGHGQMNVYGVSWPEAQVDPPTFSNAVRLGSATGALTIYVHPTALGVRWCIWIKAQSADGFESSSPAGGTNGVQATTGKIGTTDLLPLIIEAQHLLTQDFSNLVTNPSGQQGTSGWEPLPGSSTLSAGRNIPVFPYWDGWYLRMTGRDVFFGQTFAVSPGDEFQCRLEAVIEGNGVWPHDMNIGLALYQSEPDGISSFVVGDGQAAGSTSLQVLDGGVTIPAGITRARVWININQANGGSVGFYFSKADFRRRPKHLSANTIAVGSAAIAVGAIGTAMIGLLAVDDARMANVSAAKLTVGDGTIGGNLKSSNYAGGSAGWIVRPDGYAEFDAAAIRGLLTASQIGVGSLAAITSNLGTVFAGSLNGGGFNGYSWPGSGQTGYHLSASGLMIGNANDNKYFQVEAAGNVYAPGFTIINGVAKFANDASAAGAVQTINIVQGAVSAQAFENDYTGSGLVAWTSGNNATIFTERLLVSITAAGGFLKYSMSGSVILTDNDNLALTNVQFDVVLERLNSVNVVQQAVGHPLGGRMAIIPGGGYNEFRASFSFCDIYDAAPGEVVKYRIAMRSLYANNDSGTLLDPTHAGPGDGIAVIRGNANIVELKV